MTPYDTDFLDVRISRVLLLSNLLLAGVYFSAIVYWFPSGNPFLFWALVIGEAFHLWQAVGFLFTAWAAGKRRPTPKPHIEPVDILITVAGEPVDVVEETVKAAKAIDYQDFGIHILNDGYVAQKDNWREIEALAKRLKVNCITRRKPGGAKAGNINNALKETKRSLVAVLDADHVPHPDFLKVLVPYLGDQRVAFAQSPQFYKNARQNVMAGTAWDQQKLFFGPIMRGKDRHGAAFMCGTNMVIRRTALDEVGGMCETNIAEDFLTSLFMHQKGWKSVYVPQVLAEGLAPEDLGSYYKQQFRWARGSLEILFRHNPLFKRGLTGAQRFEYLSAGGFWLSGAIVLMNALLPVAFFMTGAVPLVISTMALAAVFMPYIILTIYNLQLTTNFTYTFRALAFSLACFPIHLKALVAVILNRQSGFAVTSKKKVKANFFRLAVPHLLYILVAGGGLYIALQRQGLDASVVANLSWVIVYSAIFTPFFVAALPERSRARKVVAPPSKVAKPRSSA